MVLANWIIALERSIPTDHNEMKKFITRQVIFSAIALFTLDVSCYIVAYFVKNEDSLIDKE